MTDTTLRYIDIDQDTRVGYNYIKQQYYVRNKEYYTYRNTVEEIIQVLNAIDVDTTTEEVNINTLSALKTAIEYLHTVSYTLQDTGAYIHTLQFNDFDQYPLTIDCEKAKLYIMNSTVIYDLTLNESPRNVRIPRILAFYKDTLGLQISTEDMRYFYSLLVSYYYPTCYNQITLNTDTNEYFYNNKFIFSNYSNTSDITYQCTYNPNNNAENTTVGYVISTDTSTNRIELSAPITMEDLHDYTKVIIKGATTVDEETDTAYSADGEYTITDMGTNTLKVAETIPYSYEFPYKECYVVSDRKTISSMKRDTRTITLTETPTDIFVGDIILVSGATVDGEYEDISCNGSYTVESISDKTITVEEEIPTDFTGEGAILIKEIFVGYINSISNKVITLTENTDLTLTNATIMIHSINNGITTIENFTGNNTPNTNTITITGDIEDYTPNYPQLQIPVPTGNTEVLIDITYVGEDSQSLLPIGEFMVDNFKQCKQYINTYVGLIKGLTTLTDTTKDRMYQKVEEEIPLTSVNDYTTSEVGDKISCSISTMKFKGIYSENYSD